MKRLSELGIAACLMLASGSNLQALPTGGVVSAGSTSISSSSASMTINQSSQNAAINWQGFSIGQGEAVRFVQPNSSAVALNRVLGADPSNIMGSLSANGKVFLVNPNGILFGQGAQVNVGGLVASTRNITDADFMAGRYKFAGAGSGRVLNQGSINADGGYVALLGANVSNEGTIVAKLGSVALAAGNAMTLDLAGDGLLNVTVNEGALNALANNGGLIRADGGQVLLTALSAANLLSSAVNNTGVIQAQAIDRRNGTIRLMGDMHSGAANVGGTLDASAPNGGNGGFIETSAAHVQVADDARITTFAPGGQTGTWLIDPVDFTIAIVGGNITPAALGAQLVATSVTIATVAGPGAGNGDIFVNNALTWNGAAAPGASTTLTLSALRDVDINAAITATSGNLVVCCGRDINVRAAITTTRGSVLLSAGRDLGIVRSVANPGTAITTVDGNIGLCAGHDMTLNNALNPGTTLMTLTRGSIIANESLASLGVPLGLSMNAGTAATGPGAAGGTVVFTNGGLAGTFITLTGPSAPANITYNPTSYLTPTDYSPFFTGTGGPVAARMLVFPDGADKAFDGTTGAVFTSLKGLPAGVSLAGAGTASYDTAAAGVNKLITFSGFTLAGANAANFALPAACCGARVGTTAGTITAISPLAAAAALLSTSPAAGLLVLPELDAFMSRPAMFSFTEAPLPLVQLAEETAAPTGAVAEVPPKPVVVPPPRPPRQDRN